MKKYLKPDLILISAIMFSNFANFVFNAILGRALTFEQFALLTFISTIWAFYNIFLNSVAVTTNHSIAYLYGENKPSLIKQTYITIKTKILKVTTLGTLLWLLAIPLVGVLFKVDDLFVLVAFTPVILTGGAVALTKGYLQGHFKFVVLSLLVICEAVSKVIIALIFVQTGHTDYAYLAIPLSVITAFILTFFIAKPLKNVEFDQKMAFPKNFFVASLLTALASAAFLSVDVLLAKMYLSPVNAGKYALLSLAGKMIYFFGSILNGFMVTYTAKYAGEKGDYRTNFYKIFFFSFVITVGAYLVFGLGGNLVLPFLLGEKAYSITSYLPVYGFAIALFTLSGTVSAYHLSLKRYIFSRVGFLASGLMVVGIALFHQSISQFNYVILGVSTVYFLVIMLLHLYYAHWKKEALGEEPLTILPKYQDQLPLKVGICLPAYNEEGNIGKLLRSLITQQNENFEIEQITVVSSSTDRTDAIVKEYATQDSRIKLIRESKRNGKASAINLFLQKCTAPFVVLQSTDTVCHHNTIEKLCMPFIKDLQVGMTGGAPIPINDKNTFLGYVVHTWWWFHRHIPRFGEIIAFRNVLDQISEETAVDEAFIQAKFVQLDYKVVHIDEAIIYNKGADNLSDMLKQRRRIYNGHARLKTEENVKINHVTKNTLWLMLFKFEFNSFKELLWFVGGIGIEICAELLGRWDLLVAKKNPYMWEIAESTKELNAKT